MRMKMEDKCRIIEQERYSMENASIAPIENKGPKSGSAGDSSNDWRPTAPSVPAENVPAKTEHCTQQSPNYTPKSISSIPFETVSHYETTSIRRDDISCRKIAETVKKYNIGHSPNQLLPRGLNNISIWCYVNAVLQSLIACQPFISIMQLLMEEIPHLETSDRFPFLSSFSAFIRQYSNVSDVMEPSFKKKSKNTTAVEIRPPCESTSICHLLSTVGGNQFEWGEQQDAQEALNFILNGLHEEIIECLWTSSMMKTDPIKNGQDCQGKGPKRKTCVTRTTTFKQTPFSEIFWGEFRYMQTVNGVNSVNIQPFNMVMLHVHSPHVNTVAAAFDQLVCQEEITGCSKTKGTTTVVKQVLLQKLPKILILHINRLTYSECGPLKDDKRISFELGLEIRKNLIYHKGSRKDNKSERTYMLQAVVKHQGPMGTDGHYICEIRNKNQQWLRCDDENVTSIALQDVLKHDPSSVPYLLFYQRKDTIKCCLSPPTRLIILFCG